MQTRDFLETVFQQQEINFFVNWEFKGLDGGFFRLDLAARAEGGSALIVFYSGALEGTLAKIERAGGKVIKTIFPFPGGRRFHFVEPSGNELSPFIRWKGEGEC